MSFPDFLSKSSEHYLGDLFAKWWEPEEEWFWWFEYFSKLKAAFFEYWTSIKIKISMLCISKDHEIKTKMVQEQWLQIKMTFIFFYWVELIFSGEQIKVWWGGAGMRKILARWGAPPFPPVGENPIYIYI